MRASYFNEIHKRQEEKAFLDRSHNTCSCSWERVGRGKRGTTVSRQPPVAGTVDSKARVAGTRHWLVQWPWPDASWSGLISPFLEDAYRDKSDILYTNIHRLAHILFGMSIYGPPVHTLCSGNFGGDFQGTSIWCN